LAGQMHHVRGLAMECRGIGMTELFDRQGAFLSTVRQIPVWNSYKQESDRKRHVCRYPCENCVKLMERFGIPAQRTGDPPQSAYDMDMDAAKTNAW
jgi:hypothetical protein